MSEKLENLNDNQNNFLFDAPALSNNYASSQQWKFAQTLTMHSGIGLRQAPQTRCFSWGMSGTRSLQVMPAVVFQWFQQFSRLRSGLEGGHIPLLPKWEFLVEMILCRSSSVGSPTILLLDNGPRQEVLARPRRTSWLKSCWHVFLLALKPESTKTGGLTSPFEAMRPRSVGNNRFHHH